MEERLNKLFLECAEELESIGFKILDNNIIGEISVSVSKRNNERYGVCKQLEPDESTKYVEDTRKYRYIRYSRYKKHLIEISPWVMELEDDVIKNTLMHEIIHCFPYCNNHGVEFKHYAKYINANLDYDIARTRK